MTNGSKYYGAFFWVAAVSFIIPLFVGWKAFDSLGGTSKPTIQLDASGVDHEVWNYLLKNYVADGLVDYDGMKRDYLFHQYISQLGACNPDALATADEKLALYCNAYNALVINGVITHKIKDTVDGKGFFGWEEHIFAGKTISLDHIEHTIIRPTFQDPRIHVALVCAAKSCPAIRPEAYTGARINDQLDDQASLFANSETYVSFQASKKVANPEFDAQRELQALAAKLDLSREQMEALGPDYTEYLTKTEAIQKELEAAVLSKISPTQVGKFLPHTDKLVLSPLLSWYGQDWNALGGPLPWLENLVTDKEMKQHIADAQSKKISVSYADYDWTLNSQAKPDKVEKKGGGFGSGSSPDE